MGREERGGVERPGSQLLIKLLVSIFSPLFEILDAPGSHPVLRVFFSMEQLLFFIFCAL